MKKYNPISSKVPHLLHGADYNPDQWLQDPQIFEDDLRLMKLSKCNVMSVGIFSWVTLEPEEGVFQFEWLDEVIRRLYENGVYTILATPSGARPAWMSQKYPEVLRVDSKGIRNLHGVRHNHCFTSPIYREKVALINEKLAERYKDHPGVIAWHISNEYSGHCYCPLCQDAFRQWVQHKYKDLNTLNQQWWTTFWSHTYTDWSQIEAPNPRGESNVHGLNIDFKRFITDQTIDFYNTEIQALRRITPDLPITTNFMGTFQGLDYWKFAKALDVVSWDSYPQWHKYKKDWEIGMETAFVHDLNRGLKNGRPFMLMESTPSATNWQDVAKLKRPGMHLLSSLQAIGHGSDTVQYFQWRKSRGSSEKFHGAVVDHCGHENTRVFRDVTDVGKSLSLLDDVVGTTTDAEVAIFYDWENSWAINDFAGYVKHDRNYVKTCIKHYESFWKKGISVDIVGPDSDLSQYRLLITPMLYMVKKELAEKLEHYVQQGGQLVTTYLTGLVNENDLCYLGGFPGPLRPLLGLWVEETDCYHGHENNYVSMNPDNRLHLTGQYKVQQLCDLIHLEGAQTLGTYDSDFYKGQPALSVHDFGQGHAYYIAFRSDDAFIGDFYASLIDDLNISPNIACELPVGVTAQRRTDGHYHYTFLMNFTEHAQSLSLDAGEYFDMLSETFLPSEIKIKPYGIRILKEKA